MPRLPAVQALSRLEETLMHPLGQIVRDWWRGYSETDVASVVAKLSEPSYPGKVIPITNREAKALRDPRTWGQATYTPSNTAK